ncbi:MAG: efflux RND transporter periplasmic adaptor subunit [Planctomycetes bacterium]|nr:efflux RND transporter periplasmic adaptor subunit [Planctomycetota bacterium]
MFRAFLLVSLPACLLFCAAGCNRSAPVKLAAADSTPALPISKPVVREVTDFVDYNGRINAKDSVIIQPRVTGYIVSVPFREGADVKKDDVLFEIDPRPYKAQLQAAEASVAQNDAGLTYAKETNLQFKGIAEKQKDAVTIRELNQYKALEDQALQSLKFAQANLVSAQLNLEWTKVKSPIDGRVSRYFLTPGNLVNQDVTQLTTVVSTDPMYVYFDMDEPTLMRIKRALNEGNLTPPRLSESQLPTFLGSSFGLAATPLNGSPLLVASAALAGADVPVYMGLQGEPEHPHTGFINFFDNQVNPGTGSISVRGEFKNPKPVGGTYLFAPGMFVRVRLPIGQPHQAVLVLDRVITTNQQLKTVFVVKDGKVQARAVTIGALQEDGLRVITSGLTKDDWVLVGGLQQVQDGMTIATQELQRMPTLAGPSVLTDTTGKQKKTK